MKNVLKYKMKINLLGKDSIVIFKVKYYFILIGIFVLIDLF